jgi:hypothetical protein
MAEETTIRPEQVVTSEAPRSQLSAGDIVGPYQRLANSLDKLGAGLEDMAMPLAERAGTQAVTRDADGNIQVEHAPIFGKAGDAYARAVRVAALAEGEGAAKRADIELREKYRDNPKGYQNAAQAYKDATVKQYTAAAGPEVGNAVGQAIDNTTTMTFRGLLNEKERLDLARSESCIKAGREDAANEMKQLSRANAPTGPGTAFDLAHQKYETLSNELAGNPRLAYTEEERASDAGKLQSEIGAQRYLYHVDQTYKKAGYEAAVDDASDILTNPAYKFLTEQQREAYHSHAMTEIRANYAVQQQDLGAAHNALNILKDRQVRGETISPDEVWQVRNSFEKLNNPAGVLAVDNAFKHADLHDDYGRQRLADQTTQRHALAGASMARDMYQYLISQGEKPEHAAGMVASAVFESSLHPTAFNPAGGGQGAVGFFQWRGERLAQLKAYAASQGKGYLDPQVQMEFARRELATTERVAGGLLRATTTPEEAARVFSLAYERGEGRDTAQRMALARSLYEGKSVDGSGGPGARSWELANKDATIKTSATELLKDVQKDFAGGNINYSRRKDLMDIADAARETNNIDLGAKAERLANVMDYVERARTLPLDQQVGLETEVRRQMAAGTAFEGADYVLKALEAKTKAIQEGLDKNPIATWTANNPDKAKTLSPLDFSTPQTAAVGLAQRAQIAQLAAHQWGVPPRSVLDETDVDRVKAALASPDLAVKASIWSVLATIPEENRNATFEKIAKGDPNARAEAGAGAMMATDPEMAKSIMAGLQIMGSKDNVNKQFEPTSRGQGFESDLASKFPSTAFDSETRTEPEGNYATMGQMIKARYTYLAAHSNTTEYNSKLLDQAINDVTGGQVSQAGVKTIAPERGMPQAQFDGVMSNITDTDLAGVTDQNGRQVSANFLRSQGHLEAIGPGRYLVNFGGPGEKPIYAYFGFGDTPGGVQRFVLDLSGRKPIGPQLAQPYYPSMLSVEGVPTPNVMAPPGGAYLRGLLGAPGRRELRGGDQPETPSYGGVRG